MGLRGSVNLPIQGERVFEIGEEVRRPVEARVNKLMSQYEVPPEQETKMRALTPEQSQAVVAEAEKAAPKGGVPWLLILGAGAAAVAATMK